MTPNVSKLMMSRMPAAMERPPMALPAGEPENRHGGSGLMEPEIKGVIPFPPDFGSDRSKTFSFKRL